MFLTRGLTKFAKTSSQTTSIKSSEMSLLNNFFIKISCRKIGSDEFGNEYFQNKNGRRFVAYKGIAEPSKIPAEWHGWIHHSTNLAPIKISTRKFSWQKIHLPNLTGTKGAYSPKNSAVKKVGGFYETWKI
jgi:NADH:ubiquinone oxidoreductase subunit